MRFRTLRAVVVGAGLSSSGCLFGVTGGGCESPTKVDVVEVPDDGRDCEAQCAASVTRTATSAQELVRVELDDCDDRGTTVRCEIATYCVGEGRPPAGLRLSRALGTTLGDRLAQMAAVEAASVVPFRALSEALASHGAPARLVRGAAAAAEDEVRHARAADAWRRRLDAESVGWWAPAPRWADLEALARDNRVDGVVGETWGAVVLLAQGMNATSPGLRRFFTSLARDEARHSALAVAIDRWAMGRLDPAARARVDAAGTEALEGLARWAHDVAVEGHPVDAAIGLPRGPDRAALWREAHRTLWATA
jgi:hypothetical protein